MNDLGTPQTRRQTLRSALARNRLGKKILLSSLVAIFLFPSVFSPTVSAHHGIKHFELYSNSDRVVVAAGGRSSTLIVLRTDGTFVSPDGSVTLTLSWNNRVPQGVSYSFTPRSMPLDGSSTLEFITLASATVGTFHFDIQAWLGTEEQTLGLVLRIFNPHRPGSYEIEASPLNLHSTQGGSVSSAIWVMGNHGYTGEVKLDLVWDATVPIGVSAEFTPTAVTPSTSSNLRLKLGSNSSVGEYPFHVIGVSSRDARSSPQMYLSVSPLSSITPPGGAMSSSVTLQLSEDNIILGSAVSITGLVRPGANHTGVPVVIEYSKLGTSSWTELTAVRTDNTASYTYQWSPSELGSYQLKAIWYGDAYYKMAASNPADLTVRDSSAQTAPPAEFPWFWFGLAAVGVIGGLAVAMLWTKRKASGTSPFIQNAPSNMAPIETRRFPDPLIAASEGATTTVAYNPTTEDKSTVTATATKSVRLKRTKKDPVRPRKRRPES